MSRLLFCSEYSLPSLLDENVDSVQRVFVITMAVPPVRACISEAFSFLGHCTPLSCAVAVLLQSAAGKQQKEKREKKRKKKTQASCIPFI